MAPRYCALCERPVEARRHFGLGTLCLSVLTGGLWLVAIPFYKKRCPICRGRVQRLPPAGHDAERQLEGSPGASGEEVLALAPPPPLTRDRVIAHLSERFSRDDLSLAEFERKVTDAYAAQTQEALAKIAPALAPPTRRPRSRGTGRPGSGSTGGVGSQSGRRPRGGRARNAPARRHGEPASRRAPATIEAVLGTVQRADLSSVPELLQVRAMVGSVEMDLRAATFASAVTEIAITAVAGTVTLRLPDHVRVETLEKSLLSTLDLENRSGAPTVDSTRRPIVRITGRVVLSNVTIRLEPPR